MTYQEGEILAHIEALLILDDLVYLAKGYHGISKEKQRKWPKLKLSIRLFYPLIIE